MTTEYYCDKCAKDKQLPKKTRKTLHECLYCHETKICNDNKPPKVFGGKKK